MASQGPTVSSCYVIIIIFVDIISAAIMIVVINMYIILNTGNRQIVFGHQHWVPLFGDCKPKLQAQTVL